MTSVDTSTFAEASKREHELNHRQREILDLLVDGKTNGEIAESLGMTLDGAKWNVSEILTKLGLGTREEAAEYWRWRRRGVRRVGSWMRGLFSPLIGKVALAGGAAAVAALVLFAAFGPGEGETGAALEPFYLEATFFGLAYDEQIGEESSSTLRWWFQDRDRQRVEFHDSGLNPGGPLDLLIVSDGSGMLIAVDSGPGPIVPEPGFITLPLRELPADVRFRPWMLLGAVGPSPARLEDVRDFEAYHTALYGQGPAPRGMEEVLGRPALVRVGGFPNPDAPRTTYWLDQETLFFLRVEALFNDGRRTGFEVTSLNLDARHNPGLFELKTDIGPEVLPHDRAYRDLSQYAGMTWVQPGPDVPSLPAGMLAPVLGDWVVVRGSFFYQEPEDANVYLSLRDRERTLIIRQDYDEGHSVGVGIDTPVRGATGRINKNSSGNTLAFWEGGVRVELTSPDLTHDELIAFAESLERR